jgi:hypothetical protein
MRAPACYAGFDYSRTAARAWQIFTTEHARKLQITASFSFGINIIFISRATFFNADTQNFL